MNRTETLAAAAMALAAGALVATLLGRPVAPRPAMGVHATDAAAAPPLGPGPEPCQRACARIGGCSPECLARLEFREARRPPGTPSLCADPATVLCP